MLMRWRPERVAVYSRAAKKIALMHQKYFSSVQNKTRGDLILVEWRRLRFMS